MSRKFLNMKQDTRGQKILDLHNIIKPIPLSCPNYLLILVSRNYMDCWKIGVILQKSASYYIVRVARPILNLSIKRRRNILLKRCIKHPLIHLSLVRNYVLIKIDPIDFNILRKQITKHNTILITICNIR